MSCQQYMYIYMLTTYIVSPLKLKFYSQFNSFFSSRGLSTCKTTLPSGHFLLFFLLLLHFFFWIDGERQGRDMERMKDTGGSALQHFKVPPPQVGTRHLSLGTLCRVTCELYQVSQHPASIRTVFQNCAAKSRIY